MALLHRTTAVNKAADSVVRKGDLLLLRPSFKENMRMKRYILTFTIFALTVATLSAKTKLTIKNTVGADSDEVGDYDLYTTQNETDISKKTTTAKTFAFGDRFQIDLESTHLDGRFRLETLYHDTSVTYDGEKIDYEDGIPKILFVPSGFLHFKPIQQLGFVGGTNFYKRFAIPSGYLAASDDTTKYGRLLTDSLGEDRYFTSGDVGIYSNGIAGGVTSDWSVGESGYLKLAGGATVYPEKNSDTNKIEKAVDFGVNFGTKNLLDFGFTAHDVTEDTHKFGAFAGYTGNKNLVLNTGFYYNFTDSDYLPEMKVERSGEYEFKKQTTKYALGFSGGYKFEESGFGIYGDMITGLTNEYIGKVKYYDADGNLIDTKTTTIIRGNSVVKYKDGKAKRTDEFTHEGIPFYGQIRLTYQFSPSVEGAFNFKLRTMLHDNSCRWITLYPRLKIDLPSNAGTIGAGIRFDMNAARYDGVSGISIPLTYTYKFKRKF